MSSMSAKDNRTLSFSKNGEMISMNKKKERHVAWVGNFFIICIILTKWSLAHFAELRGLSTSSQDAY
jgi:hypothetical protein